LDWIFLWFPRWRVQTAFLCSAKERDNIYLNGFDHYIKQQLKITHYIRYVDDFALFSDDYSQLKTARLKLEKYLSKLRLKIHPIKSQLFQTKYGANFLGFRILPDKTMRNTLICTVGTSLFESNLKRLLDTAGQAPRREILDSFARRITG